MFVHLNNHSDYSLKRSVSPVQSIISRIIELGQNAVAITDYGNLFYTAEFASLCKKHNVKAIFGCECSVVPNRDIKNNSQVHSLIFLCTNAIGFDHLKKISTSGYLDGFYYFPRIDFNLITQYNEGLLCIVPQNNGIPTQLLELGKTSQALQEINALKQIFNDRLYLEIQNHGLIHEDQLNAQLHTISKQTQVPLVAGNDCYYPYQQDSKIHEIFMNSEAKGKNKRSLPNDQFYIKSRKDMEMYFQNFIPALDLTLEIADRCNFVFEFIGPQLPNFPLPPQFASANEYLKHLTMRGLKQRYTNITPELLNRANYELEIITTMNYSGYFLIVWDIIEFAKRSNIPVGLGRGSAAGSIAAYSLGITNIDPIKYGLLFERFLNPDRASMPDIDTDFCVDRRQDVIDYIKTTYGNDHVGQIITFSQLKPRGTLRDVARAMDIPLEKADEIAKLIPFNSQTLKEAEASEPKLKKMHEENFTELFDITEKLNGLHRHASLHAAGIVIGANKLIDYVPLYRDPKSHSIATQYSMKYLEKCGLVKMDILGLKTLTILQKTETLIRQEKSDFSIEHIPEDDLETFEMLSRGESMSIFQFESSGMRRMLLKVKPSKIEDLIALNALYRPGPMDFIDKYADVKNGTTPISYIHESLASILNETNGIIIYQEQVMEIVKQVAGYTLAQADIFRRAMGKKDTEEIMVKQHPLFIAGAIKHGFDENTAQAIYNQLAPFAQYGFNKSHAAAYAILAYQTAYLKCHFPVYFMIACINANHNNPDELTKQLKVCVRLGIALLRPDVNHSEYEFSIENNNIRYGLCGIKTMSDEFKQHIPQERKNGPYTSILNCIERLSSHRTLIQFLKVAIPSGLFDSIDNNRISLYAHLNQIFHEGYERLKAKQNNQLLLFIDDDTQHIQSTSNDSADQKEHLTLETIAIQEREYLGLYLSVHPLDPYKNLCYECTTIDLSNQKSMDGIPRNIPTYLIGYIDDVQKRVLISKTKDEKTSTVTEVNTKKKNSEKPKKILSGKIEDKNGEISFVMYKPLTDETPDIISRTVYGIRGRVRYSTNNLEYELLIQKIMSPEELFKDKQRNYPDQVSLKNIEKIKFNTPYKELHIAVVPQASIQQLQGLKDLLIKYFGSTRIFIHVPTKKNTVDIVELPLGFTVDAKNQQLMDTLKQTNYIENIWVK